MKQILTFDGQPQENIEDIIRSVDVALKKIGFMQAHRQNHERKIECVYESRDGFIQAYFGTSRDQKLNLVTEDGTVNLLRDAVIIYKNIPEDLYQRTVDAIRLREIKILN
jgi:hypothetical protein